MGRRHRYSARSHGGNTTTTVIRVIVFSRHRHSADDLRPFAFSNHRLEADATLLP
jgi:hypothetical protein